MHQCLRSSFVLAAILFIAATLLSVPAPADCQQANIDTTVWDVIPLPEGTGGSKIVDGRKTTLGAGYPYAFGCGQTRDIGDPWQACVWSIFPEDEYEDDLLPPLDLTKESGANALGFLLEIGGSGPDTSVVAGGYSVDSSDNIQPMIWTRGISDLTYISEQLPTLIGNQGEVKGFALSPCTTDWQINLTFGWSAGVATNKAVIWTDNGAGGWTIRALPHGGAGLAGRALGGIAGCTGDTTICGWAENVAGDTTAVIWENGGGGWTMTTLPLLGEDVKGQAVFLGCKIDVCFDPLVGWSENHSGQRRAVRWHYDGFAWIVEELTILVVYDHSVALSVWQEDDEEDHRIIVGNSYGPGPSAATVWELTGEEGNDIVYDLNDRIIRGNPPHLSVATSAFSDSHFRRIITANAVTGNPGFQSEAKAGIPHAYLVVETTMIPTLGTYQMALLIALLIAAGTIVVIRRRRSAMAEEV